jgi:hypothetical protein
MAPSLRATLLPLVLLVGHMLILAGGCSRGGNVKAFLEGTVQLGGQPLESGIIRFTSEDGSHAAQGTVAAGKFRLQSDRLPDGRYRVAIESEVPTGRTMRDSDSPSLTIQEMKQIIPARYNVRTELVQQIPVPEDQTIVFSLESN